MEVDEVHRAGERCDLVRDPKLYIGGTLLELRDDHWMVRDVGVKRGHGDLYFGQFRFG